MAGLDVEVTVDDVGGKAVFIASNNQKLLPDGISNVRQEFFFAQVSRLLCKSATFIAAKAVNSVFQRCKILMASDGIPPLYRQRVWLIAATLGMGSVLFFQRPPTKEAINADVFPRETIRVGDLDREFRVVVPSEQATGLMPVLFAFHGVGDSTDSMAEYSDLDRTAAENGFLLVYPATRRFSWASHVSESSPVEANPDVTFFDALLSHLEQKFEIDSERIYLAGMSNGASFVQLLAAHRENVAAVVAHSGPSPIEIDEMSRRFPILLIAGADDSIVDEMQLNAEQYRQADFDCELVTVPGLGHEWSRSNNPQLWAFLNRHTKPR